MGTAPAYRSDRLRLRKALGLTAAVILVQAVGAWYSGSLALLSDTGHVLTDFLTLAAASVALQVAGYPLRPGSRFTYGLHRVEVLVALGSALLLLGVCGGIVWEAVQRLVEPRPVLAVPLIVVALLGLVGNGFVVVFLRHGESLSTRAAYLHALSDMASSLAVVLGGLGIWWTGLVWIDPVLSLILVGFIVRHALLLLWEAVGVVLEASPRGVSLSEIEAALQRIAGVIGVHDLHVWRVAPHELLLSAHVVVESPEQHAAVLAAARRVLQERFGIHHVVLQVETPELMQQWQCDTCWYTLGGARS